MRKTTFGLIVGNRGFFPAHLCEAGRRVILDTLSQHGIDVVALPPDATKFGAVESIADAQKCADLFKENAATIRTAVTEAHAALCTLIDTYDEPDRCYLSQPQPGLAPRYSDYAQLARVAEWAAVGDEE